MILHPSISTPRKRRPLLWAAALLALALPCGAWAASSWQTLAAGFEYARFPFPGATSADSVVAVVRINPAQWRFTTFAISSTGDSSGFSTREWAQKHHLALAINAGLYDTDRRTHVGLMVAREHENNRHVHSHYKAVFAFDPKRKGLAPCKTFDLDETPLKKIRSRYASVIQNLRLIKRPGENRWPKRERAWWSEAALGEDRDGRILLLYTPAVVTMHDFNEVLLALPLHLVSAQHLEGGMQAQLYIHAGNHRIEYHSGRETDFARSPNAGPGLPIPNVIGVVKR